MAGLLMAACVAFLLRGSLSAQIPEGREKIGSGVHDALAFWSQHPASRHRTSKHKDGLTAKQFYRLVHQVQE